MSNEKLNEYYNDDGDLVFTIYYDNFKYKNKVYTHIYTLPTNVLVEGIIEYFDKYDVRIVGTDENIINSLEELHDYFIEDIVDEMEDYYKEKCKDVAYAEFLKEAEWLYADDVDEEDIIDVEVED